MRGFVSQILMMAQSLKFFSHFGVRALLVLYLVQELRFDDVMSLALSGVFFSLIELSSVLGGIVADKYLGLRKATQVGSCFLSLGFIGLIFSPLLFESLALIVLGASLFSGNVIALFGKTQKGNEEEKKKAFTSFYTIQNAGALISVLLCSFIQAKLGFHIAFAISSLGIVMACFLLFLFNKPLKSLEELPKGKGGKTLIVFSAFTLVGSFFILHSSLISLPCMPFVLLALISFFLLRLFFSHDFEGTKMKKFVCYLGALILFYSIEDQMFSSLLLFTENNVGKTVFGFSIPAAFMMSVNPIVIILFGKMIGKMKTRHFVPFLCVSASFAALALCCALSISLHLFVIMGMITLISLAELMLGPLIYSFTSTLGEDKRGGELMGILSLAFSLAYILGGTTSQSIAHLHNHFGLMGYAIGFGAVAGVALVGGIGLEILLKRKNKQKVLLEVREN